jgi:two-component system alkaline phosphatase synthesis response regulator PhoP
VDDSENMLIICRAMLEASGYEVFTARDGKAGLELLRRHSIDVAVIDNQMPGMTGTELAREIKRERKNLPVLMFSDSGPEPASTAIDFYLNKKSGPRALSDAVAALLAKTAR